VQVHGIRVVSYTLRPLSTDAAQFFRILEYVWYLNWEFKLRMASCVLSKYVAYYLFRETGAL
jgi:hypothetical protein